MSVELKFHTGDKVRILKRLHGHQLIIGNVYEIENTGYDYKAKGIPVAPYFTDDECGPVWEVGDIVRIVPSNNRFNHHYLDGDLCTVIDGKNHSLDLRRQSDSLFQVVEPEDVEWVQRGEIKTENEIEHKEKNAMKYEVNGEMYTAEELEEMGYKRCCDCGEWLPEEEFEYDYHGNPLCNSCFEDHYFVCEDCGDVEDADDMVTVHTYSSGEKYVCSYCAEHNYYRCMDCDEYFTRRAGYVDSNDDFLCDDCYDDHYWHTCDDCGCFISEGDEYYSDSDDGCYCSDCIGDHEGGIGSYHAHKGEYEYNIGYMPGEDHYTTLTFGIEDEMDDGDDPCECVDAMSAITDRVVFEHDGSLSDFGFEMISYPGSLHYHMEEMPYADLFRKASDYDYKSHDTDTCGLHIHVGRSCLTSSDTYKIVMLAKRFEKELTKFSRRRSENLSQWASFGRMLTGYDPDEIYNDDSARDVINFCNRYQAVNLTNRSTIEFRIFRGSLVRDTVIASIQLVSNICRYAMEHSWEEVCTSAWKDVALYEEFDELHAYMVARKLIPDELPPEDMPEVEDDVTPRVALRQHTVSIPDPVAAITPSLA